MFLLETSPVRYVDPWNATFGERLSSLAAGSRRVAYFYERPDNSTFRYRAYNMIQALSASPNDISASYFCNDDLDQLEKVVDLADVIVLCRCMYNDRLNRIINIARNHGKSVYFDIDDLVFDPRYAHLVLDTLDQDLTNPEVWDVWFASFARIGTLMKLCDAVITTNDFLGGKITEFSGKPVSIIPNFLNHEQLEISRRIYQEKKSRDFARNDEIHLGYFSGTPTHNKDFDIVSDTLAVLLDSDSRMKVFVVGFMDLRGALKRYESRILQYPLHDFINLQRLIGLVEVNLMPLQDNTFTNCKSELKYFEAGVVGTISVASPVHTYQKSIRHGENGFLANSYEWYDVIMELTSDLDSYTRFANVAYQDSLTNYAWYNQIELIERKLFPGDIPK
jgi:glycosyltransferase involved in cell wall biosynthesis